MIRVLTVRRPAAWALFHAGKDVENRSRSLGPYTGPVAILAGLQTLDDDHPFWELPAYRDALAHAAASVRHRLDVRGAIIGVVDLVETHHADDCWPSSGKAHCSQWADTGDVHHLVLANPRALDEPLPWKGGLGLRKSELGVEGDWLVEWHEPCKSPCAGVYGCPPACSMDPVARLQAVPHA